MTAVTQMRNAHARCRRPFVAAALGLLLAGCNTAMENLAGDLKPSDNPVTVDTVGRADRFAEIARQQHPRILATYGGEYSDPKLERMVAKVVGGLTLDPDNPNQTYRITILNSPNVNAFALPGGYLYITRGLLALANDSAELAAVIAHEMGHVTANHGIQRQQREQTDVLAAKVVSDVLEGDPKAKAALLRNKLDLARFSRNQELEADAIGIRATGRAGYDPFAAARFLQSMSAYSDFRSVSGASDASLDFLASHPAAPQRIELALGHARNFGAPGTGNRDRDWLLAGIDGMMFGDTPQEGYVRGRNFLHPGLGVAFSVPEGFVIDNSAAAETADGKSVVEGRVEISAVAASLRKPDYLRSGWIAGLDPASIAPATVNGNEAATARAAADGWQFDITVVRAGSQVYRLLTAAPLSSTALDGVARSVSASFRILSAAEKAALKPLRIRVRTVKAGETVASLANQMRGVDRKQELFRVINALPASGDVKPGDKVKIITDQ